MPELLQKVRQLITDNGWDIYVLPRSDQHQSQYLAAEDGRVEFVSGFTGSNGIVLISQKEALLWTDGRYFLQAQNELYPGWELKKMGQDKAWFQHASEVYPGATLGIDPRLITAETGEKRIQALQKAGLKVQISLNNIVEALWEAKPKNAKPQIYVHQQWSGKSLEEKVGWVRTKITQKGGKNAIFNDLSQIAWILNLRSSEIPHNPFFKSVLIIRIEGGSLYLPKENPSLNSQAVINHLAKVAIKVQPYEPVFEQGALIRKSELNYYIYSSIKDKNPIQWEGIGIYRAVRTEKQLNGFRRCHLVDGLAMAKFWSWRSKLDQVDEYEAALYINQKRYEQKDNKGLSFDTISGGGPNGAIIHYHPTQKNHSKVTKDMIHLVDSGGQYIDGTTDVTRAFHFGNPTAEEKDAFTRVLLGNLDIQRLKWPAGKLHGGDIDILARRHLWAVGKDYMHGTGHGVAYFGGVHEGPCGISKYNQTNFVSGMIVTNEPGYYETGKFGIRIENMLLVREQNGFNRFENLTLCPYDKNLIEKSLLTASDIDFINTYHKRVWDTLSPSLDDPIALEWLKGATSPL